MGNNSNSNVVFDEYETRKLAPKERLEIVAYHLKTEEDESVRWDCVWLAGEIANEVDKDSPLRQKIADLMVWILKKDDNAIVRHEAAFQIGLHNMMDKLPDLMQSILHDKSDLVKHEAIEAVGLLRAHQTKETLQDMLNDPSQAVRDTAQFVIKRLERLEGRGEYRGEALL